MDEDADYLCVGVCMADETETCCIGCGRPWGERERDDLRMPPEPEDDEPPPPA